MRQRETACDTSEWLEEFTENLKDIEVPAPQTLRMTQIRNIIYSHPLRPNVRDLKANQDDEGSLQKAHWRSSTSSRQFGDRITAAHNKVPSERW